MFWFVSLSQTIVLACSVVSDSLRPHGLYMAHQATRSMRFSRQEYRSGLPFPIAGDLPNPGIKPASLASPALAGRFLTSGPPGKPVTDYRGLSNPHTTPCSAPKTSLPGPSCKDSASAMATFPHGQKGMSLFEFIPITQMSVSRLPGDNYDVISWAAQRTSLSLNFNRISHQHPTTSQLDIRLVFTHFLLQVVFSCPLHPSKFCLTVQSLPWVLSPQGSPQLPQLHSHREQHPWCSTWICFIDLKAYLCWWASTARETVEH